MIDLPTKAEVHGLDGLAGYSTYVIINPINRKITHLVVKSDCPPYHEVLVPLDQVEGTTPDRIKLKCTRNELYKMRPFEYDEYIRSEIPDYLSWPYVVPMGLYPEVVVEYIPVKHQNIALGEIAIRRGAQVQATDGLVGLVDELLVDSKNMQVTHLVLVERHIFKNREITIPVSQIDRVDEDTVYLKLDRHSVEMLPTTPIQRWSEDVKEFRLERKINMDKMLVVIFDSELKAYEGSRALQELHNEGNINLYAKVVIAKDANGKVSVKQKADPGPEGTAVGLMYGMLVGLIGGPVGLAIGAGAGTLGGLVYDLAHLGISEDFLVEVEQSLQPGKAAVVAEVWENWSLPVDTRMEALGGVVLRRSRNEVIDIVLESDVEALKAELNELQAECDQATGEGKAKLMAKVDATKAKLQAAQDAIQARIEANQKEMEAKVNSLQEQAAKAHGEQKARLEKRSAEVKAEYETRRSKLEKAQKLIKEALAP